MVKTYINSISPNNLLIFILIISLFNNCTEPPDPKKVNHGFTPQRTDVKTYQMVDLKLNKTINVNKYKGKFGKTSIDLIKTSDSTLTFFVPDVNEGIHELDFELAIINFTVVKTPEVNANKIVENLFINFDADVSKLPNATDEDVARVVNMKLYKENVLKLFNSLTEEQKKQTALLFEANNESFNAFASNLNINLDASIKFRTNGTSALNKQSECARIDYKTYFDCTSLNLADSYVSLIPPTKQMAKMLVMAFAVYGVAINLSALGPVAIGFAAVGMTLPLYTAIYLFFGEVAPAAGILFGHTFDFLQAPWIFRNELFDKMVTEFPGNTGKDLELEPGFRTIESSDGSITKNVGTFISTLSSFANLWNQLPTDMAIPSYKKILAGAILTTKEIIISNITSSNIKLLSQSGQQVVFKSSTGKEESFNFRIKVEKQGFVEEKTVNAKILAETDSTEIYKAAVLGWWTVITYDPNNPTKTFRFQLFADGKGVYPLPPGGIKDYPITWRITRGGNGYYLTTYGFFTGGDEILKIDRLTYPVTKHNCYLPASSSYPNFLARVYIKD